VRHEAAFALGRSKAISALTDLANACLKDPSPIVRHEAAMALADLNEPNAIPYLLKGLKDPDEEVVISCEYALEVIQSQSMNTTNLSKGAANVK
jgi:HEAT repeat protein